MFWRKRTADDTLSPPDTAPRDVRRWVESLPLLLREKVAQLGRAEQETLYIYATQWDAADRLHNVWDYFDRRAEAGTWSDLGIPMLPIDAASSHHQGGDADTGDMYAAIRGERTDYQAQIAPFRETVAALVEDHPAVMQQLVTLIYHVGAGRFDDDNWTYQGFLATFSELAPLVTAVRAADSVAYERLHTPQTPLKELE